MRKSNKSKASKVAYRINVTVSPQMRAQIHRVAEMLGLGEAAAARYLMNRGLEGLLSVLSSTQSAEALRSMFDAFSRDMEPLPEKPKKMAKIVGVPSNTPMGAEISADSLFK